MLVHDSGPLIVPGWEGPTESYFLLLRVGGSLLWELVLTMEKCARSRPVFPEAPKITDTDTKLTANPEELLMMQQFSRKRCSSVNLGACREWSLDEA